MSPAGKASKGQEDRPGRFHPSGSQLDSFPPAGCPHLCGLCWSLRLSRRCQPSDGDRPSLSLSGFEMGTLCHWKATWKGGGRKHPTEPRPDRRGGGCFHGRPVHVHRSWSHDRKLQAVSHLVDGYAAPGRSLHRKD